MSHVLVISGSPSAASRTEAVGDHVARRLADDEWHAHHLKVRTLPAEPLVNADTTHPAIAEALAQVSRADGIVLATPTYKASFSGLLKTFLDLLPRYGFRHKVVLPLATGGSVAHVLVLDYALRPVVHALGARHVVQSLFLLDEHLVRQEGRPHLLPQSACLLDDVIEQFRKSLISAS
ncbi:FMN reductase [Streptomyces sp. B3I7]|uniref:NADPH-dependent FMN reductase n=1 Tax=Streptomyces sp. B3I7 TaxID=3042269 RepID=UPI0027810434|nr:NADPH-dependent FMN reductase [Streptomyces sp. B3I7]MDQ0808649.1 FMN reductase [Streptomyces sp. B3I7]